jgi:hypothetical protein
MSICLTGEGWLDDLGGMGLLEDEWLVDGSSVIELVVEVNQGGGAGLRVDVYEDSDKLIGDWTLSLISTCQCLNQRSVAWIYLRSVVF